MSLKRCASTGPFDYRVFKRGRISFEKRVKRKLSEEITGFNKRTCYPEIYLAVIDIDEPEFQEVHTLFISSENLMSYTFSGDPRDRAACDIQRIFRGWSQRKKGLVEQFNSISLEP